MRERGLQLKIADTGDEFDRIARLNYATFVEEIPQHQSNPDRALVDKFHLENTYFIAKDGEAIVGMLALRNQRPFSLDAKLPDLDAHVLPGESLCEIRLLAIEPSHRHSRVLRELLAQLVNILRLCLHIQEQADLRCVGKLHDQPLRILQQQVHAGGQAERDADDQNIEEPRQFRHEHAAQHGAQHSEVLGKGAHHCSTPSFSVSLRTPLSCSTLSS